jgi:hypothetical protein
MGKPNKRKIVVLFEKFWIKDRRRLAGGEMETQAFVGY